MSSVLLSLMINDAVSKLVPLRKKRTRQNQLWRTSDIQQVRKLKQNM